MTFFLLLLAWLLGFLCCWAIVWVGARGVRRGWRVVEEMAERTRKTHEWLDQAEREVGP